LPDVFGSRMVNHDSVIPGFQTVRVRRVHGIVSNETIKICIPTAEPKWVLR
jgi:hypothetical protein